MIAKYCAGSKHFRNLSLSLNLFSITIKSTFSVVFLQTKMAGELSNCLLYLHWYVLMGAVHHVVYFNFSIP